MKALGDVDAIVHISAATPLEEIRWLVLRFTVFTPGIFRYSFHSGLSGPQDQYGQEEEKKSLHPTATRDRARAVVPVAKLLVAWATWLTTPIIYSFIYLLFTYLFIYSRRHTLGHI